MNIGKACCADINAIISFSAAAANGPTVRLVIGDFCEQNPVRLDAGQDKNIDKAESRDPAFRFIALPGKINGVSRVAVRQSYTYPSHVVCCLLIGGPDGEEDLQPISYRQLQRLQIPSQIPHFKLNLNFL